jgi:hypothetical protein
LVSDVKIKESFLTDVFNIAKTGKIAIDEKRAEARLN